jgi:hypothetical protein
VVATATLVVVVVAAYYRSMLVNPARATDA